MATPSRSKEEHGFQTLLERVENGVKVFGEQVDSLGGKIDRVTNEFDRRLTALDGKIDLHTRTILSRMDKQAQDLTSELRSLGLRFDVHEHSHLG